MRDVAVKTVSKVADVAGEQLADLNERLGEATEAAAEFVHDAKRVVRRELKEGWEKVEDATDDVERYIRRHPFKAAGIAFGVGAALGLLIGLVAGGRD